MQQFVAPYRRLAERESRFADLVAEYGRPDPFVWHDGGRTGTSKFAAMLLHVTSQSISAVNAFAVYDRIAAATGGVPTASRVRDIGAVGLRELGLSNAKAGYVVNVARAQLDGAIDLEHLDDLSDEQVLNDLTAIRGIGLWTAQAFLLRQLRRPDVLPAGDNGIQRALETVWGLEKPPTPGWVKRTAAAWSPYRSYAAALLWASLAPAGELSDPKARALARTDPSRY